MFSDRVIDYIIECKSKNQEELTEKEKWDMSFIDGIQKQSQKLRDEYNALPFYKKLFKRKPFEYLILLLLLTVSCNQKEVKQITPNKDAVYPYKIDSAVYYLQKEIEFKDKRDSFEIKYLRTGKKKYMDMGNKCVDSVHFYFNKLKSVSK